MASFQNLCHQGYLYHHILITNYSHMYNLTHFNILSVLTTFAIITKATFSIISLKYSQAYNLITFDSLSGEHLLQILNDVLATIEKKSQQDIR